jgi:cell division protein FtsI/penicillin-binding protein 2
MNANSVLRIRIILVVFGIFAILIIVKLYSLQVLNKSQYIQKANAQYERPISSNFDRGSIFFELKDSTKIAAATIKEGYTLAINPKVIENSEAVYFTLSTYISLDKENFLAKAAKKDDPYEEIQKRIDKNIGNSILDLKIKGVILSKESWRVYPGDSLASHTVGLVGSDNSNKIAGRYGLERYYEEILTRNSLISTVNVFAEIFDTITSSVFNSEQRSGDIVTAIEPSVQNFLDKTVINVRNKWNSDSMGAIIMDPNDGRIYAISSSPGFNPNNLKEVTDVKVFSNSIVENVFEMGSIIKPLTIAAGVDSNTIDKNFTYDDTGSMELNGKKISNFDGRARGRTNVQEILSQSLNIGAANVALKMGADTFIKYFKDFGFAELSGIDQPNEQLSIIRNIESKRDIELATASYGQGIALTPIATIRALSTLANGGKLVTPHLTTRFEYTDGTIETLEPPIVQVLNKETTDEVTKMLVKVVDDALKKGSYKMEHYSIAAKTGTAQIADRTNGGYYKDRYLHSFFGYFPAYNPRFIVFLYHVYPKNADFASETLADPFIQITKFLINYYELPPDR